MRKHIIHVLLAIAVGGGAFSVAHGAFWRRAVAPANPPIYPRAGMNLWGPFDSTSGVTITGFIQFDDADSMAQTIAFNGLVDGKIPVQVWRLRNVNGTSYLCNAETILMQPFIGGVAALHWAFSIDAGVNFRPGDYFGVEVRPYHVRADVWSPSGDPIGDVYTLAYTPPIIYNDHWSGIPIDCTK